MRSYVERMKIRTAVTRSIRDFFEAQGFLEVDTPTALTAPAPEPHIATLPIEVHPRAGDRQTRYLQPSPELPMKRLLAAGFDKIFQIAPVFRDGDMSPYHRPEFRMLEWYRTTSSWQTLLTDCEDLIRSLVILAHGNKRFDYQGTPIDVGPSFRRITVEDAFVTHAGFSILDNLERTDLKQALTRAGIHWDDNDSWDDLYHRAFLSRVEPALLDHPTPVFLTNYPAPLASLARTSPDDERISERFELFIGPLEIANGFGELTDPNEQRRRFERDQVIRADMGLATYPTDEAFFAALETLGDCAGIALGVDRLLMLLLDCAEISETAFIPWEGC